MLAIVTDSTCALTRHEAELLGVEVVPMTYIVDGRRLREQPLGENGDYAQTLENAASATTEAVRTLAFAKAFQRQLKAGNDVLCLTISSRLSGTYRSACEAAAICNGPRGNDDVHVEIIDSWCTAGALEFLVRASCMLARQGSSLDDIVRSITELRAGQQIVFSVPDMSVLRGSGRLGAMRRSLGTVLNRYPVMHLSEGAVEPLCRARGSRGVARAMVEAAPPDANQFIISHFGERGIELHHLMLALRDRFPRATVHVKDGGPVLAVNLGLGSMGLAWEQPA